VSCEGGECEAGGHELLKPSHLWALAPMHGCAHAQAGMKGIDEEQPHAEQLQATARLGLMLAAAAAADSAAGSLAASAPPPAAFPPAAAAAAQQLPAAPRAALPPPVRPALPAAALPQAATAPSARPPQAAMYAQPGGLMGAYQQQHAAGVDAGQPAPGAAPGALLPHFQQQQRPMISHRGLTGLLPGFATGPAARPPFSPSASGTAAAPMPHQQQQLPQQQWFNQPLGSWQGQGAPATLPVPSAPQPQPPHAALAPRPQRGMQPAAVPQHAPSVLPAHSGQAAAGGQGSIGTTLNAISSAAGSTSNGGGAGEHAMLQHLQQLRDTGQLAWVQGGGSTILPPGSAAATLAPGMLPEEQRRHCGSSEARDGDALGAKQGGQSGGQVWPHQGAQHAQQLEANGH
jgi:hypothetical protein